MEIQLWDLAAINTSRVLNLESHLERRAVQPDGGGSTFYVWRRFSIRPCLFLLDIWIAKLSNLADLEIRVSEGGVAESKAKLIAGLDVVLSSPGINVSLCAK